MPNPLPFTQHPSVAQRFADLHPPLAPQAAVVEANRCLNCFDSPCTAACPTHIDVPRFIKKIANGNLEGSALSILEANVLAASCSRVCPVSVLCEGACVMHRHRQPPIEIAQLQRHAMDAAFYAGAQQQLSAIAPAAADWIKDNQVIISTVIIVAMMALIIIFYLSSKK